MNGTAARKLRRLELTSRRWRRGVRSWEAGVRLRSDACRFTGGQTADRPDRPSARPRQSSGWGNISLTVIVSVLSCQFRSSLETALCRASSALHCRFSSRPRLTQDSLPAALSSPRRLYPFRDVRPYNIPKSGVFTFVKKKKKNLEVGITERHGLVTVAEHKGEVRQLELQCAL
ncbi:Protein of unknown function [Gryllus bimaculatus]|nr:Protein of unknown function [Gryllus bimaculatus]